MRAATALQSHPSTELSEGSHPSTEARLAALAAGAALLTIAARDRSWRGVGLALAGAPFVWRGATGTWGDRRSHWVAKSPLGLRVEWDAEIVNEQEGSFISWRSLPGSRIHNAPHSQGNGNGNGHSHSHGGNGSLNGGSDA